jgi:hypothetical protein
MKDRKWQFLQNELDSLPLENQKAFWALCGLKTEDRFEIIDPKNKTCLCENGEVMIWSVLEDANIEPVLEVIQEYINKAKQFFS